MSEQHNNLPQPRMEEVGGPQAPGLNPVLGHEAVMGAQLQDPDAVTVGEIVANSPRSDFETVRREYRGSDAAQAPDAPEGPGQMVSGRHETVQPLGPQGGPQLPRAQ